MIRSSSLAVLALVALAGCSGGQPPTRADQSAQAACRARAEAIFTQRDRSDLYHPVDEPSLPYTASGLPANPSAGLSRQYDYDDVVDRCLRGSEANTEMPQGAAPTARAPSAPIRPANAEPLAGPAPGAPLSAPPTQ
jgi:hypothetical protein